jgi:hypothetical protein
MSRHFPSQAKSALLKPLAALAASLLGLASCQSHRSDVTTLENERVLVELKAAIELANYRFGSAGGDGRHGQTAQLTKLADQAAERLQLARTAHAELLQEIDAMESHLASVRTEAIAQQRSRATGQRFPEFVSASGKKYLDASIASVSDAGVVVRHRNGAARLLYADLTPDQREMFALDASCSHAAERLERQRAAALEAELDRQLLAAEEKRRAAEVLAVARQPQSTHTLATVAIFAQPARPQSLLSMPPRAVGRSSNSYRYRSSFQDRHLHRHSRPSFYYSPSLNACAIRPYSGVHSSVSFTTCRAPTPRTSTFRPNPFPSICR